MQVSASTAACVRQMNCAAKSPPLSAGSEFRITHDPSASQTYEHKTLTPFALLATGARECRGIHREMLRSMGTG